MRATDDTGEALNAKYQVVPDGDHLALVLDSAGGKVTGSPHPRNHQYAPALRLLLERLCVLEAVIVSAVVDSKNVQVLPEAERSLIGSPVHLAERADVEVLRLELTSAQGPVGQPSGALKEGNNSKKIRLRLDVPGYGPADAEQLEIDLSRRVTRRAPMAFDVVVPPSLLVSAGNLDAAASVVLLWAIGQLVVGHGRQFEQAEFRRGAGKVLTRFGPDGAVPEDVVRSLVAAGLWQGTGFTRRVADRLRNKVLRAQVVDVVRDRLMVVDVDELLAEVGLSGYQSAQPTALELIGELVGKEIPTVTGAPNLVLWVRGAVVDVATTASPDGEPVPVLWVQKGLDLLRRNGSVGVNVEELGHRSAFVGAVLGKLSGAVMSTRPARVTLTGPVDLPLPDDPQLDAVDSLALRPYRKEQSKLRQVLLGDRVQAPCDLCGHTVPREFLVAAHIKRRSKCAPAERGDLRNVAMLACTFGCDRLYEFGHVTVDPAGTLVATPAETELKGLVGEHLLRLHGRKCTAHRPESEPYFAWHRGRFSV